MCKGLAHMVWWYFHPCTVLNFTDGVSGINHSLAGSELYLLLYLAVSSALHILPSVCESVSELSILLNASHYPEHTPCIIGVSMSTWSVSTWHAPLHRLTLLLTLTPRGCPPR